MSWSDDNELLPGADAISWNSLKKKKKKHNTIPTLNEKNIWRKSIAYSNGIYNVKYIDPILTLQVWKKKSVI